MLLLLLCRFFIYFWGIFIYFWEHILGGYWGFWVFSVCLCVGFSGSWVFVYLGLGVFVYWGLCFLFIGIFVYLWQVVHYII
jgi:hypothetical protein